MPKRIPTPPPPEDEPRYLTVVHPYPLHANLELPADRRALALWLACCASKDVLLAMFHKPASPGMVVIEVDRYFDRFDDLLGLHTWSEFLLRPKKEQKDKSSKVFYCHYNTGRLVEKNGWKRVDIEEHWFQGWTPNNSIIKYPYPKTSYCDVPSEAKTGAPMCRPLPQRAFPVPSPVPAPPVGSAEWQAAREANAFASPAPSSSKKGKMAAASDTASVTSASSRSTKSFPPPAAPSPVLSVMANYRAKNDAAWKRGPPSVSSVASAITSRAPSTVGSSSTRSSRVVVAPPAPPGLGLRLTSQSRTSGRLDQSGDVRRFESEQINNPPPRSPASSVSADPARRQPYNSGGPIEPRRDYEYNEEDQPKPSMVAAMTDILDDDIAPVGTSARNGRGGARPLGLDDPSYDPRNPPAAAAASANDQSQAGSSTSLWEDYANHREDPIKAKKEWKCSQHGSVCTPGICKERARFERDKRMEDNRKKWEKERIQRDARRAKAQQKRDRKETGAMGEGESGREHPPHLHGNAPSNSSGSDSNTSHNRGSSATPPPDQEDRSINQNAGDADTQSVVSSAPRACNSAAGSDNDDDDEGASVARSHTSSAASQSQSSSMGGRSEWPSSFAGNTRPSTVSAASATGSDAGQHPSTGPATRQSSRSSVSSSVRTGADPSTPSMPEAADGFPTYANTEWADPIAMAQAKEGGKKKSKGARKWGNQARNAQAQVQAVQANVLEAALDVALPPSGPSSSWGDPNVAW